MRKLKVLPSMQCDEGCGECCGPVMVTETEFQRVARYAKEHGIVPVANPDGITCPFFLEGTCKVYAVRPMICKAYGHSDVPTLTCPRGYNVNVPSEQVDRMLRANGEPTRFLFELLPDFDERLRAWRAEQAVRAR